MKEKQRKAIIDALIGLGINPGNCFYDKEDNLIIPTSEIQTAENPGSTPGLAVRRGGATVKGGEGNIISSSSSVCLKCNGKGYVEEPWVNDLKKEVSVHTCWDCLKNGRLG